MLHCSREVKCQQGCIPEIYYSMQNLVGSNHLSWVVGLVGHFLVGHGVCQLFVKNHIDRRDRRPNFVVYVACINLIIGGWVALAWSMKSYLGPAEIMYMCHGPITTVECIWVNIWYTPDWIW